MGRRSPSCTACLVLVLAAVTAGCGGGGQKQARPATISTETTGPTTMRHTTEQATAAAATPTTPVKSAGDISKFASPGNCKEFGELSIQFANALGGAASAHDLQTEAQLLQRLADGTPSEIRADFRYIAGSFSKMADAASDVAKLQRLANELDQTRFEHVGEWLGEQCGISG